MNKTHIPEFKLVGLRLGNKTTNKDGQANIDCGSLWQKFETENFKDRIPEKLNDEVFAVYFDYEGDYSKPFSYFIGCKVALHAAVPEGMEHLLIPAEQYTEVVAKGKMPDCIASSWREIWSSGLERAYKYDFEVYDEKSKDWSNAEVRIFVS
ncbi:GyrI-like domain-containing protein [Cesiribacter sp. SM1]|uniref:GyrI-like domain-containing protein n=1 Tax=Cesiribacter sp. SM1 TaxID=2861196 RepID=UPI001CD217B0|nr:GyrI-like domain-containing protein [Cesiribacter sp. SM1]